MFFCALVLPALGFANEKLYREPLGFVNLKGHHNGPSLHDPSSAILKQYGSRHDRTNLDRSETLQNSQNLTVRGITTLYKSLDPLSVVEHLAFYELYPETEEGKAALRKAWQLITGSDFIDTCALQRLPLCDVRAFIHLFAHQTVDPPIHLEESQLLAIERIARSLPNRALKGHSAVDRATVLALPPEEIDLSRALLLFQLDPKDLNAIRQYEAYLDTMALQIRARLSAQASPEEKIRAINHFIFQEMGFRFPPHSLHAKHIDLYTFLPSVLDSRQGVCLGISILYLCLAQRLDLPLEIVTPPGHIYVRYRSGERTVNIETTARGVHMPTETYLGVNTRSLQKRNIKETVGLAFFNQAATVLDTNAYAKCVELYEKAHLFLPEDVLVKKFLAYSHLLAGNTLKGMALLKHVRAQPLETDVSQDRLPEDLLEARANDAALKVLFMRVDETRASILAKQRALARLLKRYPHFREGLVQLAVTHLQLNHFAEAETILKQYHAIDPTDVTVQYYLAIIALQRMDNKGAWLHLKQAENLCTQRHHAPKALRALRLELRQYCPEPT